MLLLQTLTYMFIVLLGVASFDHASSHNQTSFVNGVLVFCLRVLEDAHLNVPDSIGYFWIKDLSTGAKFCPAGT